MDVEVGAWVGVAARDTGAGVGTEVGVSAGIGVGVSGWVVGGRGVAGAPTGSPASEQATNAVIARATVISRYFIRAASFK